jgi:hypothetical protein
VFRPAILSGGIPPVFEHFINISINSSIYAPRMNANPDIPERRGSPRLRSLKGARLVLPNQMSTFQCTVRNSSATGVGVEMSSTLGIPRQVLLKMDDYSADRMCEVIWRTEKRLGLRFLP